MKRIVQPELLDELPPGDPRAVRSRRDLRRINAWMRHPAIMARALQNNLNGRAPGPITELGAGDGDFLLCVARLMADGGPAHPGNAARCEMGVTLLDRFSIVSTETLAAFARLGWRAEAVVADVFDWPPAAGKIVVANLFLHHFEDARLTELLRTVSERAELFIAIEPRRAALPLFCSRLLWAIGCNFVTRHDAVASISAGFASQELSALWSDKEKWRLTERRAGWFSHLFIAQKIS